MLSDCLSPHSWIFMAAPFETGTMRLLMFDVGLKLLETVKRTKNILYMSRWVHMPHDVYS